MDATCSVSGCPVAVPAGASKQELLAAGGSLHRMLRAWLKSGRGSLLGTAQQQQLWAWWRDDDDMAVLQLLLYYAVCTSNSQLVQRLLDEGVKPNPSTVCKLSTTGESPGKAVWDTAEQLAEAQIHCPPVLALAVAQLDHDMVHLLLSRGADPYTIPVELYLPAMREEGMQGLPPAATDSAHAASAAWCAGNCNLARERLQEVLNPNIDCGFTMCYWLARATKLPQLTQQEYKIMEAHQLQRAPSLRICVFGQEVACCLLYSQVMNYFGMSGKHQKSPEHKPLVLLLAGPSGHGKTLIGQQLQDMLGVPYHFEDCSRIHHVINLLGASGPFKDSERQPAFAAFIRGNSGNRSVIVLDEFEKMDQDVQNCLLGLLQDGWYIDPYSQERVDCSKTVFLLTTNAADRDISNHWKVHQSSILQSVLQSSVLSLLLKPLDKLIRAAVAARTSRSLTSRVTGVVPFFPFTEVESMTITQQELLRQKRELMAPVNKVDGRTFGNIALDLKDQPKVLRKLAMELYFEEEGARAIRSGIQNVVGSEVKDAIREERLPAVGGQATMTAGQGFQPYELEFS